MADEPEILAVRTIARTHLFEVQEMDLRFANGTEVVFERIKGSASGAVLVVPMLDADTVLLVREYAAGAERYELALPKGRVEAGEAPLAAANRELMEEAGYGARRLRPVKSLSLAPGYVAHTTHVVLAQDLYPERRPGDEPEPIEVVPWRLDELEALLRRTDCTEARSIAALFLVREILRND
ncbi:MAG TPA: ADP compounds hydrolase NudE [Gammaproteobacteria bacterium]|nr:ADP compounds hydrolase NudE [Gammaproteobacteria bacterium]